MANSSPPPLSTERCPRIRLNLPLLLRRPLTRWKCKDRLYPWLSKGRKPTVINASRTRTQAPPQTREARLCNPTFAWRRLIIDGRWPGSEQTPPQKRRAKTRFQVSCFPGTLRGKLFTLCVLERVCTSRAAGSHLYCSLEPDNAPPAPPLSLEPFQQSTFAHSATVRMPFSYSLAY